MKIVVIVGLFGMIACSYHSANGILYDGKTDNCTKRPAGLENLCYRFMCNEEEGEFRIHRCGFVTIWCRKGQRQNFHEGNLTKPYPDCCPIPYCRNV